MSNKRGRTKAEKECGCGKLLRIKTDCTVRLTCVFIGAVMAIAAVYCFTFLGNFANGVVSAFSALVLVCVASEYKVIEVELKKLKLKIRR